MQGRTIGAGALLSAMVAALTMIAAPAGAAPATRPAGSAAGASPGSYVAVTPSRVIDTRSAGGIAGRATTTVTLTGTGSPAVPASATAVVINLTVSGPTSSGYLTAWAAGTATPGVSNVNFPAGGSVADLAIVPLGTGGQAGKISLFNGAYQPINVYGDLTGYYTGSTPSATQQGAFGAVPASRDLDTAKAIGVATTTPVKAHSTVTFQVEGKGQVPTGVSAVALNITALSGSAGGYARAYASDEAQPNTSTVNWIAGQTISALAVVRTGSDGTVSIYNGSSGTVRLLADVQGYWTAGDPVAAGDLGAVPPLRVRSAVTIGARATLSVPLAGQGGIPRAAVATDVFGLAVSAASSGYLTAYSGSTRPGTSNLNFVAGRTVANLVAVAPSASGTVSIYNGSAGSVKVYLDTQAYVTGADLSVPVTTTSRYVSDLSAISGSGPTSEGCQDGTQGPSLVLLDVGAQTITSPLSAQNPGVALVFSDPTKRVSYADLVDSLMAYLDAFVQCQPAGHTARIAVGTNNDGAFSGSTAYAATLRGTDWATKVIKPLQQHAFVSIVGALDLEAGFSSSEAQAEQWETSFLANTSAGLVVNGSADNCPATFGSTADCGPVIDDNGATKTWTRAQYVRLTYGLGPGRISVLPQLYLAIPDQAAQWANIDATSGGKLTFVGSLTQRGNCGCGQTPSQAWAALYHAKATQVATPVLPVATDLQPS